MIRAVSFRMKILLGAGATCLLAMSRVAGGDKAVGGAEPLPELSGGLKGYISMSVDRPPDTYRYGVSFYAAVWPLLSDSLDGFQIGLPSTWIIPDNTNSDDCLCPKGTVAGDNWPERGPSYRDVFQTIEGGLGYWGSTQFGSTAPKYRMNGTPDCYSHEISSPGWGFGNPTALAGDKMGIAQLSNRILVPPDGLTFKSGVNGQLLGNAWMALPLADMADRRGATERKESPAQCWTLFLNAVNFKGAVAYWIPETWSHIAKGYPLDSGRTLDAKPALMSGGAMEANTVPYFESADASGVKYTKVPDLHFPVDSKGNTVLMQDIRMYSRSAIFDRMLSLDDGKAAFSGRFDPAGSFAPICRSQPIGFRQGPKNANLTGLNATVDTTIIPAPPVGGKPGGGAFGLHWTGIGSPGRFPEYFKQQGNALAAIPAMEVPVETRLLEQQFAPEGLGRSYESPATGNTCWTQPGPRKGPFRALLSDGSVVTYYWYRFVDQPSLQQLKLTPAERERLQAIVDRLHRAWPINGDYMEPPTSGALAELDRALLVTPPKGMEVGFVPIVVRQSMP